MALLPAGSTVIAAHPVPGLKLEDHAREIDVCLAQQSQSARGQGIATGRTRHDDNRAVTRRRHTLVRALAARLDAN